MDEYNEVPQSEEEAEEQAPRRPGTDLFEWLQLFLGSPGWTAPLWTTPSSTGRSC